MTIAELTVAGALLLLLLGLTVGVLYMTLRTWVRNDVRSQVQQDAMVVTSLVMQEFRYSHVDSVVLRPVEVQVEGGVVRRDAIALLSAQDARGLNACNSLGELLWQRHAVIYHDRESRVLMQQLPLETPSAFPSVVKLPDFTPSPSDHVVGKHVRALRLEMDAAGKLQIEVEVVLEDQTSKLATTVTRLAEITMLGGTKRLPSL